MRKIIKRWFFKEELEELKKKSDEFTAYVSLAEAKLREVGKLQKAFQQVLNGVDVSVDVHQYSNSRSWAVVSLQGQRTDFIKFIDLGHSDMMQIASFLHKYERAGNIKIDATPETTQFLRISKK